MKRFLIPSAFILIIACQSKQENTAGIVQTDTAKKNYLPVAGYIQSEIANVDSFPYRLMLYHVVDGKTDSGLITTAVFDRVAKQFLVKELDSTSFENKFEENSFIDRSTDLISFTYSTKDTANGLKRVDVLLSPGQGTNKLHSIYMESIAGSHDSSIISKMSWNAGRNMSILHIRKSRTGPETTDQTLIVWDPSN